MTQEHSPILPGATIGILGSGQLGRMLALEARRMGYHIHVYSPDMDTPAGQIADMEIAAPYEDLDAVRRFAQGVDVVTFEFENVPSDTASAMAEYTAVRPHGKVLHITQNRAREKSFLRDNGFPVAPFALVTSRADLDEAVTTIGTPGVLKTAAFGYDGKGQAKIMSPSDLDSAWQAIGQQAAVYEKFIDFTAELSCMVAMNTQRQLVAFPIFENHHVNHILDLTISDARLPTAVKSEAVELSFAIIETLDAVGVIGIEYFCGADGSLIVNEIAPRTHNSGHLTFGGSVTSQFEQQLRAICGLPLGSPDLRRGGVAMANLLGDLWNPAPPRWERILTSFQEVHLHLYGKAAPRKGRKMGHITALADTPDAAAHLALSARYLLTNASLPDQLVVPPPPQIVLQ